MPLPRPGSNDDKQERGTVLVVGGSRRTPGAMALAATAALRAGAGKLQIAIGESAATPMGIAIPESLVLPLRETRGGDLASKIQPDLVELACNADAVVLGPGMFDAPATKDFVLALLSRIPAGPVLVLDAGALGALRDNADALDRHAPRVVLTPHYGEAAAMLSEDPADISSDPTRYAREASRAFRAVVALKGSETIIAAPGARAWRYSGGDVGLATSGSGDTLAGIVGGLAARGAEPATAALWGVFLHGEAGNTLARKKGRIGFLARELLAEIPRIMDRG